MILSNCNLNIIPNGLTDIYGITYLDLSGNLFNDDTDLSNLEMLYNLEILFLSRNHFTKVPAVIRKLPKLRMLAMRENQLATVEEGAFPDSLEWLILTGNRITHIGAVPSPMRKLMLSNNLLTGFPRNLASLTKLELLRVANNRIPEEKLGDPPRLLPSLKWYSCSDNPMPASFPTVTGPLKMSSPLNPIAKLGEGSSGQVYRAVYKDQPVAWKVYRQLLSSDGLVMSEINMAALVGNKKLPFLQRMAGWYQDDHQLCVAWLMPEDEHEFSTLAKPPSFQSCTRDVYDESVYFDGDLVLGILRDVVEAVAELHRARICHGDIYGHNIRVNKRTQRAVLMDLGASWQFAEKDRDVIDKLESRAILVLARELLIRGYGGPSKLRQLILSKNQTMTISKFRELLKG